MGCGASQVAPQERAPLPPVLPPDPASLKSESGLSTLLAPPKTRDEKIEYIFAAMDLDGNGSVDATEYKASVKSEAMLKFFSLHHAQNEPEAKTGEGLEAGMEKLMAGENQKAKGEHIAKVEWLEGMGKVHAAMGDAAFDREIDAMLKQCRSVARKEMLTKIFFSMDLDGNGTVEYEEYKDAITSEIMLKFFKFLDAQGDADGILTLGEWLKGMGQVGQALGDEQFSEELRGLMAECMWLEVNRVMT